MSTEFETDMFDHSDMPGPEEMRFAAAVVQLRSALRDPGCTKWTCPTCGWWTPKESGMQCAKCGFDATDYAPDSVNVGDQDAQQTKRPYWDTPEDRAAWDAHSAAGANLPAYDDPEITDEHRRMWFHLQRLTTDDIGAACGAIVERIGG